MVANFEPGFLWVGELPTEDWTGIGVGLAALLAASFAAAKIFRQANPRPLPISTRLVFIGAWISLLAYCVKSGMVTPQRLIAPYYPLLIASLLIGRRHAEAPGRRVEDRHSPGVQDRPLERERLPWGQAFIGLHLPLQHSPPVFAFQVLAQRQVRTPPARAR